jgi:uncharacterized LabA/DUF88 family protein
MKAKNVKIAVFYDGSYFQTVNKYYKNQHSKQAHLSYEGLHDFICDSIAQRLNIHPSCCEITKAMYFRGIFEQQEQLIEENILLRHNIQVYKRLLRKQGDSGQIKEKGIDTALAAEMIETALRKQAKYIVLLGGDEDFAPVFEKIRSYNSSKTVLLSWNLEHANTQASYHLIQEADIALEMESFLNSKLHSKQAASLFVQNKKEKPAPAPAANLSLRNKLQEAPMLPVLENKEVYESEVLTLHPQGGTLSGKGIVPNNMPITFLMQDFTEPCTPESLQKGQKIFFELKSSKDSYRALKLKTRHLGARRSA